MPNFTYTSGRPAGNLSPAQQRSDMQTNNDNNKLIWEEDHVGFNVANGGLHQHVTLPSNVNVGAQAGLASGIFSGPGTADAASSQLFYRNSLSTFPLSLFKAYGFVTGTTLSNAYNITSVTNGTTGQYVVTMSVTLPTVNYAVIVTPGTPSGGGFPNITVSCVRASTTQFTIYTQDTQNNVGLNVPNFSFIVLQV